MAASQRAATAPIIDAGLPRCSWSRDTLCNHYHDSEWGVPLHDERLLFEFLVLDGAQAGLSWLTILRRRPAYRRAFHDFDVERVARFTPRRVEKLLADAGIIRNRLKIESAVANARAFLKVQEEFVSFDRYIWQFVDGRPRQNAWKSLQQLPACTPLSDTVSKDLKGRGFRFVGSTICYAYMQTIGMVNDHLVSCFRHAEIAALSRHNVPEA